MSLTFEISLTPLDITLDLRLGDESYELRIAAHHSLVVQSLTKELRRLALVVRESFHRIQSADTERQAEEQITRQHRQAYSMNGYASILSFRVHKTLHRPQALQCWTKALEMHQVSNIW